MRLCRSTFVIVTCVTCLAPLSPATTGTSFAKLAKAASAKSLEIAQASPQTAAGNLLLKPGNKGSPVTALQTQLKQLGYYNGAIDGQYSKSTQNAVAEFQKAVGLPQDGIVGPSTRDRLQAAQAIKNRLQASQGQQTSFAATNTRTTQPSSVARGTQPDWLWWSLVLVGVLGAVGGLLYLLRRLGNNSHARKLESPPDETPSRTSANEFDSNLENDDNGYNSSGLTQIETDRSKGNFEQTSRLLRISIVDELIKELNSPDPTKRHKTIWDLGQQGDSRAIQPLADLMIDSGSQQRSLILAALSEIGTRTLKPMNRALAVSLQDENADVRKNAIRDLTRVYDMMVQLSQLLSHAVEDPDAEVQETARWALTQINRMRPAPTTSQDTLPFGKNSVKPPETPPGEARR